jgi:hypothetical protein
MTEILDVIYDAINIVHINGIPSHQIIVVMGDKLYEKIIRKSPYIDALSEDHKPTVFGIDVKVNSVIGEYGFGVFHRNFMEVI